MVIGAIPFFARLVETNLLSVENGKVEAALMAGASNRRIRWSILVREALPGIIQSVTVLAITLVGYSAMAGVVGAGGLGKMAIDYGYHRFQTDTMMLLGRCDHHHRSVNSNDWRHAHAGWWITAEHPPAGSRTLLGN